MKNIIYILFMCICSNALSQAYFSYEQQKQIDSINKLVVANTAHDTDKVNALFVLADFYYLNNPDSAINFCETALKLSKKANYKYGVAESSGWIGYLYYQKGRVEEALNYYSLGLEKHYELDNKIGISNALNNIGYVYKSQNQYDQALSYYIRSLKIREEIGDKKGQANSLNNIGLIYSNQGLKKDALINYKKSLKIRQEIGDKRGEANSLNNIGVFFKTHNNIEDALFYFHKSLNIRKEIGDQKGVAHSLINISQISKSQGKIENAIDHLKESLRIGKELGYPKIIEESTPTLFLLYQQQKKYKEALEMYKLHIEMRDSLNNESTQKAAIQQQAKYEYEKQKAIDDAEHEKEIAIEQEAKEKQAILTYATGGGLGLVGIFLLIVFNRLKVTRKQKNIIEEQKQEVEHQKEVVEKAHTQLEEKNKEITDSIQYAKRIQSAILPPNKVVKEYLTESFILYKPKDIVAGDFYWLEQKDNKVLFAAADCTGHGVPGAMVSVVCNNGLNRSVREYNLTDPGKILDKTREIVVEEFEKSEEEVKDGMDIALCSLEGNKLQYAGAHNPLWIIRKDSNEIEEIKANKQPIGKFDNPEPYTTHTIELQKGDSIYIFSDGYADQFGGEKGKKLKTANFKKLLLSIQKENMQKQKELIDEAFETWKGSLEQLDDVCVIGVNI